MFPEIGSSTLLDKVIVALSNLKGQQYEKLYIKGANMGHHSSITDTRLLTVLNVSLTVSYSLTSAAAQSSSAVASLCINSGNLSSLVVGSCSGELITASGNALCILFLTNSILASKRKNLAVSLILVSSNKDFDCFMQNYNMHGMGKTVNELHVMLKLHEETLPKKDANPALHAIRTPPPPKKDNPAKDAICHQCGEIGHWRRNCPVYLAELMKKKKLSQGASTLGLQGSKKLKLGALSHYMGHGHRETIEAIGTYHLELPSGLVIVLNNCHYTRGISKGSRNHLGKTIKSLRSNRRGEYISQEFLDHLKVHGIIAHHTPSYTPQNNGVLERRNRTLLDMVRSMTSKTTLPKSFWDYALETAARILNMVLTKKVEKTPYENVEFFESKLLDQKASGSVEDLELIQEEDTNPSVDTSLNHEEDDQEIDEPQTALLDPESKKWLDAINVEMKSMKDNDVWVLDELPPNARTIGSKWLFKKKSDIDASGSYIAILILYVDDILLMGNNIPMLQDVKSYLGRSFAIKDLGDVAYILRIKIYRDRSKWLIGLCQSAYIEKILKRYYMENSKRRTIPMQEKLKLSKSQGASTPAEKQDMQYIPYALATGSIMYVVRYTRPDVAFTQNMTS
uniref:Retrotransposon protein, putative, Ty1-copia subclass n=1 Tax=Tanacetum cinerariifolium TaxID=118510 RepID=A0A699GJM2_TANCI|nr:retrotransposon protein, putative, Ty1-copia subclass [Tanacetum cinerariifolium]